MLHLNTMKELLSRMDFSSGQEEMKVTYFGYRRSRLAGKTLAKLPRSLMRDFEACLAARAGVEPDNHTGYFVKLGGASFYVHCGDDTMLFATDYALGDY